VEEIGLCVNEALANVIRHAYRGQAGRPIEIEAQFDAVEGGRMRIRLRDWGSGGDPSHRLAQLDEYDPLTPGGLGLLCIGRLMHEVHYRPQDDGMVLTMVRRR
jgi:anti-sigma regulatory factor (Ser/Thr protein kinase)